LPLFGSKEEVIFAYDDGASKRTTASAVES
jgi:hypothetical protein